MKQTASYNPPDRSASSEPAIRALRWALIFLLGGLAPLQVIMWEGTRASVTNIVLGLAIVIFSAVRTVQTAFASPTRFASVIFYIFVYVFTGMASLAQLVQDSYPLDNRHYTQEQIGFQLLGIAAGIVAFEIGSLLAKVPGPRLPRHTRADNGGWRLIFSPTRTVIMGCVGLLSVSWQVAKHGVSAFFVSREMTTALLAGQTQEAGAFYLSSDKTVGLLSTFVAQYFVFIALYLVLYSRRRGLWPSTTATGQLGWQLFSGLLVAANVIVNNPIGNGRWWFCLVIATLLSAFLPVTRRRNVVLYAVGALVVLLFAFTFLDAFRVTDRTRVNTQDETGLINDSYPVLQMGLNGDEYVEANGHTNGRQLAGAIFGFVPRALWSSKPIATGQVVDPQYARSASAWTELYVDFGLPGVVAFFLIYGMLVRRMDEASHRLSPGTLQALFPVAATYQLFFLRGSFLPAIGVLYQLLFLFALVTTATRLGRSQAVSRP